jgi:hypothetical protein
MRRPFLALLFAGLLGGAVFGLSGCYATSASVGVGVEAGPPAPYYYDYGYRAGNVWIDGHWAWTEGGWHWYPGYWVAARPGYMYVQGYWDFWGGRWLYRPGAWARYRNGYVWVGGRWHQHRADYRYYDHRRGSWVRGDRRGYHRPPPRDHRDHRYRDGGRVRDHRDHRGPSRRARPDSYRRRR